MLRIKGYDSSSSLIPAIMSFHIWNCEFYSCRFYYSKSEVLPIDCNYFGNSLVTYARFDRWKDKFPISIVRVFSAVKYCGILATTSLITEDKSYKWNCSCLLPLSLLEVDGGEKWDEIVLVVSKTNLSNSIFKDSFLSWQGFTFLSEERAEGLQTMMKLSKWLRTFERYNAVRLSNFQWNGLFL